MQIVQATEGWSNGIVFGVKCFHERVLEVQVSFRFTISVSF
jgi:hypothetical protein